MELKIYAHISSSCSSISSPFIPFTTEEITGCTNEAPKGTSKAPRNPPSCFFVSCFTVSVTPSIDAP